MRFGVTARETLAKGKSTKGKVLKFLLSAAFFLLESTALFAGVKFDAETGVAVSGYSNVRIPGDTETEISLSKDLNTDPRVFVRGRFLLELSNRRTVSILLAPLTLNASGSVPYPVLFQGGPLSRGYGFRGVLQVQFLEAHIPLRLC